MVGAYFWTICCHVELDGSYARGFEDATKLCYAKVTEAKTLEKAGAEVEKHWGMSKSRKVWIPEKRVSGIWKKTE